MKKIKIIIGVLLVIVGMLIMISGLFNKKEQEVVIEQTTIGNKTQISNTTTTSSTTTTKKVVKTTKKTTTKKVSGFNVKASKSEMQQYAKSILSKENYEALDFIITHESGWNANNINKKSGASGLCQALPASKMKVSGNDYKTNYKTQINWCILYCNTRYGSIQKAKQFWLKHHWF